MTRAARVADLRGALEQAYADTADTLTAVTGQPWQHVTRPWLAARFQTFAPGGVLTVNVDGAVWTAQVHCVTSGPLPLYAKTTAVSLPRVLQGLLNALPESVSCPVVGPPLVLWLTDVVAKVEIAFPEGK